MTILQVETAATSKASPRPRRWGGREAMPIAVPRLEAAEKAEQRNRQAGSACPF